MNKIHSFLINKGGFYSKWHKLPAYSKMHMTAFIAFAVLASLALSNDAKAVISEIDNYNIAAVVVTVQDKSLTGQANTILKLLKQYDESSLETESQILTKLNQAIATRKNILKKSLLSDPKLYLSQVFPQEILEKFPEAARVGLEQIVETEGSMNVYVSEDFKANAEITYELNTSTGKKYKLHFTGEAPKLLTGAKVKVRGVTLDNDMVVSADAAKDASGTSFQITSAGTTADITGVQKTIVIMFNFQTNASQPWTKEDVTGKVFTNPTSANLYFQDTSFNQLSMTGDVVGWYTIPYSPTNCNNDHRTWQNAADQEAIKAGISVSSYPRKIYLMNTAADCPFAGRGSIGGNPSYSILAGYNDSSIYAHEFGHNLGEHHARSITCGTKQIDTYGNCSVSEYGDYSDVMGYAWGAFYQFNGPHKVHQGWIPSSKVQTVTAVGTYTIGATESNDASIKVLKIPKPDTNESYFISYRQPIGFDANINSGYTNGVTINIDSGSGYYPMIVDSTPGDGSIHNGPLTDGATFTDPANGISITQVSHNATGATVNISFPAPVCITANPTSFISPSSQSGSDSKPLTYSLYVTNNDSKSCPTSTFSLSNYVPSGWTGTFAQTSLTVAPGTSGNVNFVVSPSTGTPDGSYNLSAYAQDAAGRSTSAGATYVSFTDTTPPKVTITSPLNNSVVNTKKPTQIKANASDSSGIQTMTISLNGTVITTCSGATSCSINRKLSVGTHTITVTATDKSAGKLVGTASIQVTAK